MSHVSLKWALTIAIFSLFLHSASVSAWADELSTAKQDGLVGETGTGYLAAVKPSNPGVQQLIARINAERKAKYQSIASANGTPVAAVEGLAGKKAIEMTPPGQYVQDSGSWRKK